jgi:pyridoxamine 5'-phosphate oxidase
MSTLNNGLSSDNLNPDPIGQFDQWLNQAKDSGIRYPTAMSLATVTSMGTPEQRFVMLRDFNEKGFVFYTNLSSRKSEHLSINSNVSLIFPWHMLERQVQITGHAEKLTKLEVLKYFSVGSKGSKLSAWLSEQSSPVSHRDVLENKVNEIKKRFSRGDISMPPFFGGYRIIPNNYEFWQSGIDRINDRFIYSKDNGQWNITRVTP